VNKYSNRVGAQQRPGRGPLLDPDVPAAPRSARFRHPYLARPPRDPETGEEMLERPFTGRPSSTARASTSGTIGPAAPASASAARSTTASSSATRTMDEESPFYDPRRRSTCSTHHPRGSEGESHGHRTRRTRTVRIRTRAPAPGSALRQRAAARRARDARIRRRPRAQGITAASASSSKAPAARRSCDSEDRRRQDRRPVQARPRRREARQRHPREVQPPAAQRPEDAQGQGGRAARAAADGAVAKLRDDLNRFTREEAARRAEERARREEEAQRAREALERENIAPEVIAEVVQAPKVEAAPIARGDYGSRVGTTTVWHHEIESVRQVPDRFLKHPKVDKVEALEVRNQGRPHLVRPKRPLIKGAMLEGTFWQVSRRRA
jgi:hypothetical protein